MTEKKTIRRSFYISDFEEEQEFLSSQHNAGCQRHVDSRDNRDG